MLGTIAVLIRNSQCGHASASPKLRVSIFLCACTFAIPFVGGLRACYVLFGPNIHTVISGRVYRGAQPSGLQLRDLAEKQHIKTVINLRGRQPWVEWYREETAAAKALGLRMEDVWFSPHRLPIPCELHRFIELLDEIEYPVFIHCRRGADRSGFASAVILLLQGNVAFEDALRQIGVRYGHLGIGSAKCIGRFFEQYAGWLRSNDLTHSSAFFRHWTLRIYQAEWSCAPLEVVEPAPKVVRCGEPTLVKIRARNNGTKTWHLRPTTSAGMHLWFQVYYRVNGAGSEHRAGLVEHDVAPGESYEFTVVIPPLNRPGRYRILFDMIDEQRGRFQCIGLKMLALEIEARENTAADRN